MNQVNRGKHAVSHPRHLADSIVSRSACRLPCRAPSICPNCTAGPQNWHDPGQSACLREFCCLASRPPAFLPLTPSEGDGSSSACPPSATVGRWAAAFNVQGSIPTRRYSHGRMRRTASVRFIPQWWRTVSHPSILRGTPIWHGRALLSRCVLLYCQVSPCQQPTLRQSRKVTSCKPSFSEAVTGPPRFLVFPVQSLSLHHDTSRASAGQ